MCAPCKPQAFSFVVTGPETLRLGRTQGSRYTTFLSHYSRRLFTSSTIPGFGWPFLLPLMSCVFILIIILFWLLAAAAQSKDGDVPERNSSREGHEIGRLLLLERLIERVSICVCVFVWVFFSTSLNCTLTTLKPPQLQGYRNISKPAIQTCLSTIARCISSSHL